MIFLNCSVHFLRMNSEMKSCWINMYEYSHCIFKITFQTFIHVDPARLHFRIHPQEMNRTV